MPLPGKSRWAAKGLGSPERTMTSPSVSGGASSYRRPVRATALVTRDVVTRLPARGGRARSTDATVAMPCRRRATPPSNRREIPVRELRPSCRACHSAEDHRARGLVLTKLMSYCNARPRPPRRKCDGQTAPSVLPFPRLAEELECSCEHINAALSNAAYATVAPGWKSACAPSRRARRGPPADRPTAGSASALDESERDETWLRLEFLVVVEMFVDISGRAAVRRVAR